MRCKSCRKPLVTVGYARRCAVCGQKASLLRAVGSEAVWTEKGAQRAVTRKDNAQWAKRQKETPPSLSRDRETTPTSWQEAEQAACYWMRSNGFHDARLTPAGADGGIDVISHEAVAQVKFHQKPVGIGEVQRLFGISQSISKRGLFFSLAGYTPKAVEWGQQHGLDLYTFTPIRRV